MADRLSVGEQNSLRWLKCYPDTHSAHEIYANSNCMFDVYLQA